MTTVYKPGRRSSFYAGVARRARPYDVDHYGAFRHTDGLIDSLRLFTCRNPSPTAANFQLPGTHTCRTAVGVWTEHLHHWAGRSVFFLPRILTPILDIPFFRCEEEEHYACEVVKILQNFKATNDGPVSVSLNLVCLPNPNDTTWFAGEGVHQDGHSDGDFDTEWRHRIHSTAAFFAGWNLLEFFDITPAERKSYYILVASWWRALEPSCILSARRLPSLRMPRA